LGTASHFLANSSGRNLWLVVGSYDVDLILVDDLWQIRAFRFNLKFIDGNTDLPALAQERVKQSGG
jgi:hypothetical protein